MDELPLDEFERLASQYKAGFINAADLYYLLGFGPDGSRGTPRWSRSVPLIATMQNPKWTGEYLVGVAERGWEHICGTAHLWTGDDTLCKGISKGKWSMRRREISRNLGSNVVCVNCQRILDGA